MSKRKREMRTTGDGDRPSEGEAPARGETDLPGRAESTRERPPRQQAQPQRSEVPSGPPVLALSNDLKENILLAVLILYVLLLAVGTAGELFEVDAILNLPLFK